MLTWIERKLAATLFADPPTATLEETTECFEKVGSNQGIKKKEWYWGRTISDFVVF